jgi:hypothetical protein
MPSALAVRMLMIVVTPDFIGEKLPDVPFGGRHRREPDRQGCWT